MPHPILLLIAHGSRSKQWNDAIIGFCQELEIHSNRNGAPFSGVRFCFLEHANPEISTAVERILERDRNDIFVLPFFLSAGYHVSIDIPEEFAERAQLIDSNDHAQIFERDGFKIHLMDPIHPADLLAENAIQRFAACGGNPEEDGMLLVYYGSKRFPKVWQELCGDLQSSIREQFPHQVIEHAFGGDAVGFEPDQITKKLVFFSNTCNKIAILPMLVAVGMIQTDVIAKAIENTELSDRILYRHDSILPDSQITETVFDFAHSYYRFVLG